MWKRGKCSVLNLRREDPRKEKKEKRKTFETFTFYELFYELHMNYNPPIVLNYKKYDVHLKKTEIHKGNITFPNRIKQSNICTHNSVTPEFMDTSPYKAAFPRITLSPASSGKHSASSCLHNYSGLLGKQLLSFSLPAFLLFLLPPSFPLSFSSSSFLF